MKNNDDEDEEELMKLKDNIDTINKGNLDSKIREIVLISNLSNNNPDYEDSKEKISKNTNRILNTNYNGLFNPNNRNNDDTKSMGKTAKDEVFKRLFRSKKEEIIDEKLVRNNKIKFFELINDNLLFIIYSDDGCTLLYKIEWNKNSKENSTEISTKKWKADECRIIRIAKNIKGILGYSIYKPGNDIILIAEIFPKKKLKENNNVNKSLISLYKLKKILIKEQNNNTTFQSLNFEYLYDKF